MANRLIVAPDRATASEYFMHSINVPGNRTNAIQPPRAPACAIPVARGLNREQAAAYIGVSTSTFDKMVADGRMPRPRKANTRTIWDRLALDRAFDRLPGGEEEADDESQNWDTEA